MRPLYCRGVAIGAQRTLLRPGVVVEMLDASNRQGHGPLGIYNASTNAQGEVLEDIFVGALLFVTHTRQPVFVGVKRGSFVLLRHVSIVFEWIEQCSAQRHCVRPCRLQKFYRPYKVNGWRALMVRVVNCFEM